MIKCCLIVVLVASLVHGREIASLSVEGKQNQIKLKDLWYVFDRITSVLQSILHTVFVFPPNAVFTFISSIFGGSSTNNSPGPTTEPFSISNPKTWILLTPGFGRFEDFTDYGKYYGEHEEDFTKADVIENYISIAYD